MLQAFIEYVNASCATIYNTQQTSVAEIDVYLHGGADVKGHTSSREKESAVRDEIKQYEIEMVIS